MVARPVEAVWVWYVGDSVFKAIYGRFDDDPNDKSWTKDYLQVSGGCRELLTSKFPEKPGEDRVNIKYRWPNGSADGHIKFSADRHHLSWSTATGAPQPWRLAPQPTPAGPQTLPGDPNATTTAEANAIYSAYKERGLEAYLVVVKLKDESDTLHIRVYIADPPPGLSFADIDLLPEEVRSTAAETGPSRACSGRALESDGFPLDDEVARLISALSENPNVLLIGPPGTGKTVLLERLTEYVENPGRGTFFDPDISHSAWSEGGIRRPPGKARTVVFHPSYSYDNLVLGLMPRPAPAGVEVRVTTGPLINLAHYAAGGSNPAVLVLDEFNRGNAAAILGDALALLDKDKRGQASIDLPYGDLPIEVPDEFASGGGKSVDPRFSLPPNLWIVAAMNSSDRSVAPIDAALRRRFSIIDMPPDYDVLALHINASNSVDYAQPYAAWTASDVARLAVDLLKALNYRIDAILGQDFRIGQSNFWNVAGSTADAALRALTSAWDTRIVPTLRMSLQDNDESLAPIVCAGTSDQAVNSNDTSAVWWKSADESFGPYGQARLHFNELSALDHSASLKELLRLAGK
ncbi:McrB family protein [Mycobacterium sp. E2989]|uniref:McrB family protein n=1 Tax=Mycobacterium sp. E2989 TaxID=1834140 RepID=UPI0009EDF4D2|nr:AAA family ATPase [Mycobacterium sp. E2989]